MSGDTTDPIPGVSGSENLSAKQLEMQAAIKNGLDTC
jgi:hypothetical protein